MDSDPHGSRSRLKNGHKKLASLCPEKERVTSAKTEITRLESKRFKD
jgi:hypothetical protein